MKKIILSLIVISTFYACTKAPLPSPSNPSNTNPPVVVTDSVHYWYLLRNDSSYNRFQTDISPSIPDTILRNYYNSTLFEPYGGVYANLGTFNFKDYKFNTTDTLRIRHGDVISVNSNSPMGPEVPIPFNLYIDGKLVGSSTYDASHLEWVISYKYN